jgi:hypothetical protein
MHQTTAELYSEDGYLSTLYLLLDYYPLSFMADIHTPLAALSIGKKDLKMKIRVANMWTVPDKYLITY